MQKRIVLALTGASGMPYAVRLARFLGEDSGVELALIVSEAARKVMALESEDSLDQITPLADHVFTQHDIGAAPASGSWPHHGMVVCPCSMASLAAIAQGLGSNLVHRSADVALKERRPLVLVTRETPLNRVHLVNMLAATDAGAVVLPASPGFYTKAATVDELVDFVVARILDHLGIPHQLIEPWGG